MQRVEAFLVLQFEVDGCARDQHVDDIVVVSCDCVVQGRVALNILHRHHRRFSDRFQRQSELPGPPPTRFLSRNPTSVCPSVTSRYYTETAERIALAFVTAEASLGLSYTLSK